MVDDPLKMRKSCAKLRAKLFPGSRIRTGDIAHWLRIDGMVTELYDVSVLPNITRPMALGFKTDEIHRIVAIGEAGLL